MQNRREKYWYKLLRAGEGNEAVKKQEDVTFKGTKNGVLVILSDQQDYSLLKQKLATKLEAAEKFFFPGAHVTIDVGQRVLTSGQLLEMDELLRERHGLRLLNIIHSEPGEAVEQIAAAGSYPGPTAGSYSEPAAVASSGVVLSGDFADNRDGPRELRRQGRREAARETGREVTREAARETARDFPREAVRDLPRQAPQDPNEGGLVSDTVLIRRTLRSGQRVKHNGNVVVLGDVNPGAEVIAAGDIVVMGVLRGVAHAGAMGNQKAVVAAFRLQPTQLRIANFITRAPDDEVTAPSGPEVAQIKNGIIVIEDYLPR